MDKDTIFQKAKPRTKSVEIPEWGVTLNIREFSAGAIVALGEKHGGDDKESAEHSIIASVVDDDGNLMFSDADVAQLRDMGAAGRIRLNREINALNGIGLDAKN